MTYRHHAALAATILAAVADNACATSDFVFADDFEGAPTCGSGFVVLATPSSQSTRLQTTTRFLVKTRACGAGGVVNLAVGGAPSSWTTTFDPSSLTIAGGSTAAAVMSVTVPSDGDAGLGTFDISAQNGVDVSHTSADLNVANELIMHFAPDGTGSGTHAFPPSLSLRLGAKVRLFSDDTTQLHVIHADITVGPHEGPPGLSAGGEFDVTAVALGSGGHLYCHNHGTGTGVTLVTVTP